MMRMRYLEAHLRERCVYVMRAGLPVIRLTSRSPQEKGMPPPQTAMRDRILLALTFCAGSVDAVCYLGMGQCSLG